MPIWLRLFLAEVSVIGLIAVPPAYAIPENRPGNHASIVVIKDLRAEIRKLNRQLDELKERLQAPEPLVTSAPDYSLPMTSSGVCWDCIAECESGGDWGANTGNGFFGGLQFLLSTWHAYGGTGYPHHHSREQQIAIASGMSLSHWPICGAYG